MDLYKGSDGVVFRYKMDINEISIYSLDSLPEGKTTVSIPSEIEGFLVTSIYPEAFLSSNVSEIIFPDTIKIIGWGAFDHCDSLEKFNIPRDLEGIHSTAFACCSKLTSITIPGNVYLGTQSFFGCDNLRTIKLEEGIKSLPAGIFNHCGIKRIFLPDSLTEIKYEALDDVPKDMIVHCSKGSFAEKWAKEHNYQIQYGRTSLTDFLNETLTDLTVVK